MKLSPRSRIKHLWRHPVGHELMLHMLQKTGRSVQWVESPLIAHLPLLALDRYTFPGFTHFALELCMFPPRREASEELPAWWKEAVIYQIFLPSFMDSDHDGLGDFAGIVQRLPYLSRLGVDALWLFPVLAQGTEGGISSHRSLHKDFGTNEDFNTLVQAVHSYDMRIIIDINLSYISPQHPWFDSVLQGGGRPDYFIWKPGLPPWEASLAEKNWRYISQKESFCLVNNRRVALNWSNPDLRAEFADILQFWLNLGIDGFCLGGLGDLAQNSQAASLEPAKPFFERGVLETEHLDVQGYLREVFQNIPKQDVLLLGKINRRQVCLQTRSWATDNNIGLSLLYGNSHRALHSKEMSPLALQSLRHFFLAYFSYFGADAWPTLFWESHKTSRILNQLSAPAVYQNLLSKMLATWLLCLRGTPVLYQGEELGLYGPENEGDFLSTQTPFPWNSELNGGFTGATPWLAPLPNNRHLHAAGQMENPRSVWRHHATLIVLRRQYPCLLYGTFKPVFTNNQKTLCFFRILGHEKCYVEISISEKQVSRPGRLSPRHQLLLSNYETPSKYLRPYEANVYLCENG